MFPLLQQEAEKLTKSSAFRYGDATSFSVPLAQGVSLPGTSSPADYLTLLDLKEVPARVLVVGAANGGIVAELLKRGAKEVIAIETRDRFHNSLPAVLGLLAKGLQAEEKKGLAFRIFPDLPVTEDQQKTLGLFDLILWPEGSDEVTEPKKVLQGLAACLSPTGKLYAEILHGSHGWSDRINSWRPNMDAMIEASQVVFGKAWDNVHAGRGETRRIYALSHAKRPEAPKPEEPKVEAPKPEAPKAPAPAPTKIISKAQPKAAPKPPVKPPEEA